MRKKFFKRLTALPILAMAMLAAACSAVTISDEDIGSSENRAVISGTSELYSSAFTKSATLTARTDSGNFSLFATSSKKVTIPSIKNVTVNGKSLDRKIALGGGGSAGNYRCISFQTGGAASVTVSAAGASGRYLALTNSGGSVLTKYEVSSSITSYSYSVSSAGTYYLMSTGSGIDIYYVKVAVTSSGSSSSGSSSSGSSSSTSSETAITLYKSNSKVGTYSTIQKALNAAGSSGTYTIVIPKGTYKENYINYNGSASITLRGATSSYNDTVIKGHGKNMKTEKGRELMEFTGSCNIVLQNLSLVSDYDRKTYGSCQAEVLGFDSTGTIASYNCAFKSHQDTVRTAGKAWFYNCFVEGDTDFIWMESNGIVALYEKCTINSVYDSYAGAHESYVMAPRTTKASTIGKGVVLLNCTLKNSNNAAYLFRNPWGSNSNYYNQGAVVGCSFSGSGWVSSCAKSAAMGTSDQQYIGWKLDSSAASSFSGKLSSIGTLSSSVKSSEYSGRRAILNRNVNTSGKFSRDTGRYWDIDKTISNNGWSVVSDSSSAG